MECRKGVGSSDTSSPSKMVRSAKDSFITTMMFVGRAAGSPASVGYDSISSST